MPTTRSKTSKRTSTRRKTAKRPTAKGSKRKVSRKSTSKKSSKKATPSMKKRSGSKGRSRKSMTKKSSRKVTRKAGSMKTACITGSFDGDIMASGHVHIAPGSTCKANLKAGSVQVDGAMNGNVMANKVVQLGTKCKFKGTLVAPKLVAADGAAFEGFCKLGGRRKAA